MRSWQQRYMCLQGGVEGGKPRADGGVATYQTLADVLACVSPDDCKRTYSSAGRVAITIISPLRSTKKHPQINKVSYTLAQIGR